MFNVPGKTIGKNLLFSIAIILTTLVLTAFNSASALAAAPEVSIDDIADYINNLPSISGAASDDDSDLLSVELCIYDSTAINYWDGSTWVGAESWLIATGTASWSYNTSSIPFTNGSTYTVKAKATDSMNESTETSDSFTFDTTTPTVMLSEIPDFVNLLSSVSGTAAGTFTGELERVQVQINDTTGNRYWDGDSWESNQAWLDAVGITNWHYDTGSIIFSDGSMYTVKAISTDRAGNESPEVSDSFTFDTTHPTVTLSEIPDFVNTLSSVSGTAADTLPGDLERVQVQIINNTTGNRYWNGSFWVYSETWLDANGTADWSYDTSSITFTDGNTYTIKAKSNDRAGNESTEASDSFTFDITTPTVTLSEIPDFVNTLSSVSGTAAGTFTGELESVQIQINDTTVNNYWDGDSWESTQIWIDIAETAEWSYDTSSITFTDGNTYTVKARSIDRAGNESTDTSDSFTFDTTSPMVTLNEIPDLVNTLFISGTASDDSPGLLDKVQILIQDTNIGTYWNGSFWINGEPWVDAAGIEGWSYGANSIKFTDGNMYTIKIKSIDKAGNESTEASDSFTYDATYPVVTNVTSSNTDGTYTPGDDIEILVIFSEEVNVTGTPYLDLDMETTIRNAIYESGDGTNILTFRYTIQDGDISSDLDYIDTSSLKLDGGTITDAAGNNATLALAVPGSASSLGANNALVIEEGAQGSSLWIVLVSIFGVLGLLSVTGGIIIRKRRLAK